MPKKKKKYKSGSNKYTDMACERGLLLQIVVVYVYATEEGFLLAEVSQGEKYTRG